MGKMDSWFIQHPAAITRAGVEVTLCRLPKRHFSVVAICPKSEQLTLGKSQIPAIPASSVVGISAAIAMRLLAETVRNIRTTGLCGRLVLAIDQPAS